MARKDPAKTAQKWADRLKGSTTQIRDGVTAVTEAPGKKAAAAQEKMKERLIARIDDGTWARRVAGVPVEDWQEAMLKKGLPRIGAGADAAVPKQEQFFQELDAHQQKIDSKLADMPNVSLTDGIQRAVFQIEQMAKFRKS